MVNFHSKKQKRAMCLSMAPDLIDRVQTELEDSGVSVSAYVALLIADDLRRRNRHEEATAA